ncbi:hypothetical protein F5Y07DRAFT_162095 [Xylaria sp. FL0933]|nr:hypothetical protein F5Y07DRAFT_162095 [Xylaria sp. FL0933]
MTADPLPATLSFLTDAAHLLSSASPQTSAHLMSQRNSLMFENGLDQSDVQRQRVCGCCGHIMIAGRDGDELAMESSKTRHPKRRRGNKQKTASASSSSPSPSSAKGGCRKTWNCGNCGRYTTIKLPPPDRIPRRRFKQMTSRSTTIAGRVVNVPSSAITATTTSITEPTTRVSANASSKKRAKNRKQGLQALLQQSSSSKSQSGLGLSLSDFMQN